MTKIVEPTRESPVSRYWDDRPTDNWVTAELDEADREELPPGGWWPHNTNTWHRASASGEVCTRSITIWDAGYATPLEPRVKRIFRVGNKIEDAILEQMKKRGIFASSQQRIEIPNGMFRGTYDCTVFRRSGGPEFIGEIKSINDRRYNQLPVPMLDATANVWNLMQSHRGYITQWMIYSLGSGKDSGFLLFENKNNGEQKEFWLTRIDQVLEDVYSIFREAAMYSKNKVIAPMPSNRNPSSKKDDICRWCGCKQLCMAMGGQQATREVVMAVDRKLRPGLT